jgi:tRNA(adenine34) deaminase
MHPTPEFITHLMKEALHEAAQAAARGEVPVGAVIAHNQAIIGRGHNLTESNGNVAAHAEILAMSEASKKLNNWRLSDCILCVTLEPCTMCLGAIRLSRIPTLIFGAGDSRQGAVGSLYDLSQDERLGPPPRVIRGISQQACEDILTTFFKQMRSS